MATEKVSFFSRNPVLIFTMPTGKELHFIGGQYTTAKQDEIDELDDAIDAGSPLLSRKELPLFTVQKKAMAIVTGAVSSEQLSNVGIDANVSNDIAQQAVQSAAAQAALAKLAKAGGK